MIPRTPQYPKKAFLEARQLKTAGFSYTDIVEMLKGKYPRLKHKNQAFRLVRYPIENIPKKT